MSVIPDSDFGAHARTRLRDEQVVWFTTTGADGTPQPNPVWFLWDEADDSVLIYNRDDAKRIEHIAVRPRVSLNFDGDGDGGNIVVMAGVAEQALDAPPAGEHEVFVAKYAEGIKRIGMEPSTFAQGYSVALRVRITKVRGF
jgi:PPOX class probable F420-dependent enzyme